MYIHFTYKDGSNPYIIISDSALFDMIKKYYLTQTGEKSFVVNREWGKKRMSYKDKRELLQDFAQRWQENFPRFRYSWEDLANYTDFFERYGKKYGLLREFRENGII